MDEPAIWQEKINKNNEIKEKRRKSLQGKKTKKNKNLQKYVVKESID